MEKGWVMVYSTTNLAEAELIKVLLEENEIVAVMLNKQSSTHLIGEAELYVKNDDVIKAKQCINHYNLP